MKRALIVSLILAMLFSALAGTRLVYVGMTNPSLHMHPLDPHAVVLVQSPINQTAYYENAVYVTFSLNLSEWTPRNLDFNPTYSFSSTVMCYLDWHAVWQETVMNSPQEHVFSVPLAGLSDGLHSVIVKAKTNGTYWDPADPLWRRLVTPVLDSSNLIYFTVDSNSKKATEHFPTMYTAVAIIASVVAVTFGLVAFFLRRNRKRSEK
jgi:hypothetical protein